MAVQIVHQSRQASAGWIIGRFKGRGWLGSNRHATVVMCPAGKQGNSSLA